MRTVAESTSTYVLGINIDFHSAFNHPFRSHIIGRIADVSVDELSLWRSYFSGRKVVVSGKISRFTKVVKRGCPQGSRCEPFVWNLISND